MKRRMVFIGLGLTTFVFLLLQVPTYQQVREQKEWTEDGAMIIHSPNSVKSLHEMVQESTWYLLKTPEFELLSRVRDPYVIKIGEEASADTAELKAKISERFTRLVSEPTPSVSIQDAPKARGLLGPIFITLGWPPESLETALWRNVFLGNRNKLEEFNHKEVWSAGPGQWQMISFLIPWGDQQIARRIITHRLGEIADGSMGEISERADSIRSVIDSLWGVLFTEEAVAMAAMQEEQEKLQRLLVQNDSSEARAAMKRYIDIFKKRTVDERSLVSPYLEAYGLDHLARARSR